MNRLFQKLLAEGLGTALLLAVVVGSGIMAERLAVGNVAIALLGNTFATVWGLRFLISVFGPLSGAHFNPVVSAVVAFRGGMPWLHCFFYVGSQMVGAVAGVFLSHLMFDLPVWQISTKPRGGPGQWVAELVATAGLLLVILRVPADRAAVLVASYIGAAYWFTSSTSFANPAAAFGRMFSETFAGIAPECVPAFVVAQCGGALLGVLLHWMLGGDLRAKA
jgi:glycerol uptake facilitator-like aquaporin